MFGRGAALSVLLSFHEEGLQTIAQLPVEDVILQALVVETAGSQLEELAVDNLLGTEGRLGVELGLHVVDLTVNLGIGVSLFGCPACHRSCCHL